MHTCQRCAAQQYKVVHGIACFIQLNSLYGTGKKRKENNTHSLSQRHFFLQITCTFPHGYKFSFTLAKQQISQEKNSSLSQQLRLTSILKTKKCQSSQQQCWVPCIQRCIGASPWDFIHSLFTSAPFNISGKFKSRAPTHAPSS